MVYSLSIAVVGESMTGKSAICNRLCLGESTDEYLPTTCCQLFKTCKYHNGENYHVKMWDISGNPRFKYKRKEYLSGSVGIFLVYDVTRDETFASCKDWLSEIKETCPSAVVVILANKIDLNSNLTQPKFDNHTVIRTSAVWQSPSLGALLDIMLAEIMSTPSRSSVHIHNKGLLSFANTHSQAKCLLL